MQFQKNAAIFSIALMAAVVALPAQAEAQQPGQQEMCTARVTPAQLQANQEATPVTITVSQAIGQVTSIDAGESGIQLADAENLPRTPLAAPNETPRPIQMGDSENQWIIFLDTSDAEPGQHELTFRSERGECTANITVGG